MSQAFEDIEGCDEIVDDILIWGRDEKEHNDRLAKVLKRARAINLKLNKEKSKILRDELSYIGYIITAEGVKPNPDKVKGIAEMKVPTDIKELQRFMGMVNYLGKFLPNLSNSTQALRELLQKETAWHWDERHDHHAFQDIKVKVTDPHILKYYDVNKPVTVSVDASSYGLGACLLQEGHPISYASRSLNDAEKNYAQIEKELLAVVYGCTKYHQYIYGKQVEVETDHKPLEYLFKKPLTMAPPRLQRMMLQLQKYDLLVGYKPGKSLYIADTLSRAPTSDVRGTPEDNFQVHITEYLPITEGKLEEFRQQTKGDPILQDLHNTVMEGWPNDKGKAPLSIREYWHIRDEITAHNGVLLRGERLIVPTLLRNEMLQKIHQNHFGIEKCKRSRCTLLVWYE
ncbi:hypothetical protein QZH41_006175 [Actinostola sp. cb2023]|nr:hypothetical protein QZH41_006175 [Actinostola sp. cb2023]